MPLRRVRAALLYSALTVALTWPLAFRLHIMDAGDSAFFAWAIGWERHALLHRPARGSPTDHLPSPALHARDGRARAGHDACSWLPLFPCSRATRSGCSTWRGCSRSCSPRLTAYLLARELGAARARPCWRARPSRSPRSARTRSRTSARWGRSGCRWCCCSASGSSATGRARDALLAGVLFALDGLRLRLPRPDRPRSCCRSPSCPCCGAGGGACRWRVAGGGGRRGAGAAASLSAAPRGPRAARLRAGAGETVVYSAALESFLATSSWNHVWGEVTGAVPRPPYSNNLFPGLVLPVLAVAGGAPALAATAAARAARPSRSS